MFDLRHQHVFACQEAQDAGEEVDAHALWRPDAMGVASGVVSAIGCRMGVDGWRHDVLISCP